MCGIGSVQSHGLHCHPSPMSSRAEYSQCLSLSMISTWKLQRSRPQLQLCRGGVPYPATSWGCHSGSNSGSGEPQAGSGGCFPQKRETQGSGPLFIECILASSRSAALDLESSMGKSMIIFSPFSAFKHQQTTPSAHKCWWRRHLTLHTGKINEPLQYHLLTNFKSLKFHVWRTFFLPHYFFW